MSEWQDAKNRRALARLNRALPAVFPGMVLTHALKKRFIPPMPRLAVNSYWNAHPLRADRLARKLAARSGTPRGWTWRLGSGDDGLPRSFRVAPTPYREAAFARGSGVCCICGQPVYRLGWHVDLWSEGPNRNASWHAACVTACVLKRLQAHRCPLTGKRLAKGAEVDHRVPLFQVWREHRDAPWPSLLAFWGAPNLQVINRDAHAAKCADEAGYRSGSSQRLGASALAV
jgi:hypothetical protein